MIEIYKKITEYISNYSKIYIMTHKNPDLDGLGSAICLSSIITDFGIENYVIDTKEDKNSTVLKMYKLLEEKNISISKCFYKEALKEKKDYLLIVLDVNKDEMVESKELLENSKNVIVIDHHIKGDSYIKNTLFSYIDPSLSSITELMAFYLKYLEKSVNNILATIMLTGIEIDTNNYKIKTTEKTYEAAAFLTSLNASLVLKQELLKEDKQEFIKKSDFVKKSYMYNENMAICKLDNEIYAPKDLAEIAEQLLEFENVEASFCIGKIKEDIVGISARSIGNINVETIMKKLNGGGHFTDAATQLSNSSIKKAEEELKSILK